MTHQPTILIGDVCDQLATLPAGSVHCVVTSPPYWGLRDYGTGQWEGGDPTCDHLGEPYRTKANINHNCGTGTDVKNASQRQPMGQTCTKCGATREDKQIGLEPTFDCGAWAAKLYGFEPRPCPGCFICQMVRVFEGVWRVLRDDGTCWVNMGDSYSATGKNRTEQQVTEKCGLQGGKNHQIAGMKQIDKAAGGLGCKQRYMQPATLAKALQAHGWMLRDEIIWHKPNPMPESVTDRTTKAHEMVYLLTKGPRYFYDAEAIKESTSGNAHANGSGSRQKLAPNGSGTKNNASMASAINNATAADLPTSRNARSVWTIKPQAFPEAHFATYPVELPTKCIKAGASAKGCCPACGAPWKRVVAKSRTFESGSGKAGNLPAGKNGQAMQGGGETKDIRRGPCVSTTTTGWERTCGCMDMTEANEEVGGRVKAFSSVPCAVLDPFSGSGTTGIAAIGLGHRYIGIELNPEYAAMSLRRIAQETRPSTSRAGKDEPSPLFAEAQR